MGNTQGSGSNPLMGTVPRPHVSPPVESHHGGMNIPYRDRTTSMDQHSFEQELCSSLSGYNGHAIISGKQVLV